MIYITLEPRLERLSNGYSMLEKSAEANVHSEVLLQSGPQPLWTYTSCFCYLCLEENVSRSASTTQDCTGTLNTTNVYGGVAWKQMMVYHTTTDLSTFQSLHWFVKLLQVPSPSF